MLMRYKIIPRKNPIDSNGVSKYYATVVRNKDLSYRDLINEIATLSTVNQPDVMAVLESLFQLVPKHLKQGQNVHLGDLGAFYLNIKSEGAEDKKEFNPFHIKGVRLRFRPSTLIKDELSRLKFRINENGKEV
jgi:predicted histone-like DNA-binding protein